MIELLAIPGMALARRIQGGNLPYSRALSVVSYALLCGLVFNDQFYAAVPAFVATCLMMLPSHEYDPRKPMSTRYVPFLTFGYVYALAYADQNYQNPDEFCWSCWGEAWLGFSWACVLISAKHTGLILGHI